MLNDVHLSVAPIVSHFSLEQFDCCSWADLIFLRRALPGCRVGRTSLFCRRRNLVRAGYVPLRRKPNNVTFDLNPSCGMPISSESRDHGYGVFHASTGVVSIKLSMLITFEIGNTYKYFVIKHMQIIRRWPFFECYRNDSCPTHRLPHCAALMPTALFIRNPVDAQPALRSTRQANSEFTQNNR